MSDFPDQTVYTPPEIAARLRIKPERVLAMIRAGELRAIDVSSKPGVGRPRYRVYLADLLAWERRREAKVPVKQPPRRRRKQAERKYF